MFFPDYLFYKLSLWFFKQDGESGSRAVIAVSIVYMAIPWTIAICLAYFLAGGTWLN
jgi:hypothetical protein